MKQLMRIVSVLLLMIVLCYMTPLNVYSGYVIIGLFAMLFFSSSKKIMLSNLSFLIFYSSSFFIFLLFNVENLEIHQLNNSIIMFFSSFVVYYLISNRFVNSTQNSSETLFYNDRRFRHLFELLYIFIVIFYLSELLYFAYSNLQTWASRFNLENNTFPFGWHHVDFAIFAIGVFSVGMKRGYRKLSFVIAVITTLILPSRTWRLFLLLFIFSSIFSNYFYRFLNMKLFNSFFKLTLWLIGLTFIFSLVFVIILPNKMNIAESHKGLFDTSNYERFSGFIYSYQVLFEKKFLFKCANIDSIDYVRLVSSPFSWAGRPHSTYLSLLISYSVVFGLFFIKCISNIVEDLYSKDVMPYYLSYIITSTIVHDMFSGIRLVFFFAILIVPFKENHQKNF